MREGYSSSLARNLLKNQRNLCQENKDQKLHFSQEIYCSPRLDDRVFSFPLNFKCTGVLLTCMPVHFMCAVPAEARRGCKTSLPPGTVVTSACESPCGY